MRLQNIKGSISLVSHEKKIDIEKELAASLGMYCRSLTTLYRLKPLFRTPDKLGKAFREPRKAVVPCENIEYFDKIKRAVDILSLVPGISSFQAHFDETLLQQLDAFIAEEKYRNIKIAYII